MDVVVPVMPEKNPTIPRLTGVAAKGLANAVIKIAINTMPATHTWSNWVGMRVSIQAPSMVPGIRLTMAELIWCHSIPVL